MHPAHDLLGFKQNDQFWHQLLGKQHYTYLVEVYKSSCENQVLIIWKQNQAAFVFVSCLHHAPSKCGGNMWQAHPEGKHKLKEL
jgi:hypothetical protein